MKVTVKTADFLNALNTVRIAIPKRATLGILKDVKITTELNKLAIVATDLGCAIIVGCPARIEKDGAVCLHAQEIIDLIKNVESGKLSLETKTPKTGPELLVTGGDVEIKMAYDKADDFPSFRALTKGSTVKLRNFINAVKRITFAMATEENRPILHGICIRQNKRKMYVAAADGFRMAMNEIGFKGNLGNDLIIDAETITMIQKLFTGDVQMFIEDAPEPVPDDTTSHPRGMFTIKQGNVTLVGNRMVGDYPHLDQLIPTKFDCKVEVTKDSLLKALKLMAPYKDQAVRMVTSAGMMRVYTQAGYNTIAAKVKAKGKIRAAYDHSYLTGAITNCDGPHIIIKSADFRLKHTSAMMIKEGTMTQLLMPKYIADFEPKKIIEPKDIVIPEPVETHMEPVSTATPAPVVLAAVDRI